MNKEAAVALMLEAWENGQFADDADWEQAKLVRAALRAVCEMLAASAPTLGGGDGEVAVRAKTVHRRIDALCEAANTAGADYFDASTSMLIATRDLLTALGFPHRMVEPKGLTEEQFCAVQCAEEALRAHRPRGKKA